MQLSINPSQSLRIAMLFSIFGGYLNSFSLLSFSGHLASLQSANLIFMGINLWDGNFIGALSYLLPIVAFAIGAGSNYLFRHMFSNSPNYLWQEFSIVTELIGFSFIAIFAPFLNYHVAIALLAFFAAIQADTGTNVHGATYASIMSTGNLRTFASNFSQYLITKDKLYLYRAFDFFCIISSFFIGAFIAVFMTRNYQLNALYFLPIILIIILLLMHSNRHNFLKRIQKEHSK